MKSLYPKLLNNPAVAQVALQGLEAAQAVPGAQVPVDLSVEVVRVAEALLAVGNNRRLRSKWPSLRP